MKRVLYFVAGATIGSVITFFATRKHFSDKTEHDIQEIRNYYSKKSTTKEESDASTVEQKTQYEDILINQPYSTVENARIEPVPERDMPQIEVIDGDEYGNKEGYDAVLSYIYYSNGVLTDENNDPLSKESIANTVGTDFYKKFIDDALYIRNHEIKCDFEILLDESEYFQPTISG